MNPHLTFIGLIIDAIGALAIVVPEFSTELRLKIYRITPIIRSQDNARRALAKYQADSENHPIDVTECWLTLWGSVSSEKFEGVTKYDVQKVELGSDYIYHVFLKDGSKIDGLSRVNPGRDLIEDHFGTLYRRGGATLLSSGFALQAMAVYL